MKDAITFRFARLLCLAVLATCTGCFELPESQTVGRTVLHLDQNWTPEQRKEFYHASQGTVLMKASWFLALEQPEIKFVGNVPLFRDDEYISRFGFLPDKKSEWNPEALPVGFAISDVQMPDDGETQTVVGLTCAACHTGQLHFKNSTVRIDGAPALIDVTKFQQALGAAFLITVKNPLRFDRFAHRVLKDDFTEAKKLTLAKEVVTELESGLAQKKAAEARQLYDGHDGGFGRTDALAKIGNFVFGTELKDDNLRVGNAPVRFPPLWDTPWFDWTQYNGSIEQPMVRNIGEALGVRALVNLNPDSERFLQSTVDIENLHRIERLLSGDQPLQGLQSPRWPESAFGYIDAKKARAGAELYANLCQKCHLAPLQSEEIWEDQNWISNYEQSMTGGMKPPLTERKYLNLRGVNVGVVGTDPGQATNFFGRYVNTGRTILPSVTEGPWEKKENDWAHKTDRHQYQEKTSQEYPETILPVGVALQKLTVAIAHQYYDKQGFTPEKRERYSGGRNPAARSPLQYRPRPLNGIWASPPYLHNGSVRTLFQLLSPLQDRDQVFYTGTRTYDPVHLGYENEQIRGAFRFDTRVAGNLNTGHLFDALPTAGSGVIGPRLTTEERFQLIEFIKTLGPAGPPPQTQ